MKNIRANIVGASYEPDGELVEKVMSKKDIKKRDEIADAISTKDMKDRYGDKNVKYAIATKIVMDKKKKKKKEEMKEELDEKDKPFVKKLVKNLKKGSKTHEKQAKKLEKAMNEDITDEALTIQNWNVDDIKFTEIETVDIIKAKPLKESVDWRIKLIEKFKFSRSLGKFIIRGTKPSPKVTGKFKAPDVKFTPKRSFFQVNKDGLVTAKELSKSAVQTPLAKLRTQDVTKTTNIEKLAKKYKKVVKDPNFKAKTKKYVTDPQLGGGKPVSRDGMIMPKTNEAEKTKNLIDKYKINNDPKPPKPVTKAEKPKGFTSTKSGNYTRNTKKKNDGKGTALARYAAGAAIGYAVAKSQNRKPSDVPTQPDVLPERLPDEKPMIKAKDEKKKKTVMASYDWRAELDEDWQKVNRQDKTDGLSKKAVKAYRRENPGSKLKTAVTKDPKKLKKGSKDAKRRLSFCRRMKGMKKRLTSAKTARDPDSRINKALRRWNC